jgi:hypothetical protein
MLGAPIFERELGQVMVARITDVAAIHSVPEVVGNGDG